MLTSCSENDSSSSADTPQGAIEVAPFTDFATIEHAQGFAIEYREHYKLLTVYDPWNNGVPMHKYRLIQKGASAPVDSLNEFIDIAIPVEETVCLSTTHLGFINALGLGHTVIAVDETDFVFDSILRQRIEAGQLTETGGLSEMRLEKMVDTQPDLIMVSPMEGSAARAKQLQEAGIPFAFNIEWQESTLLARSEWIKFVAAFYNAEGAANAHFEKVSTHYEELRALAATADEQPLVLPGGAFKGMWYMPGGNSFIAHLIADAGGDYKWKDEPGTGSFSLSMEQVVDGLIDADIWLNPNNATSLLEIENADERYKVFRPFKEQKVYNNNARLNAFDSNDYWESGTAYPDRVLADLVYILHPQLLPEHELYYYHQLQ